MNEVVAALRDLPGEAGVDLAAVRAALEIYDDPTWRVVLAGRVGAGKTSLVNGLLGESRYRVGLGGVTREVCRVPVAVGVEIVDTPGIDGAAAAEVLLARAVEQADAVLWVVDGLQPCTGTERAVLDHVLRRGDRLDVVVSHLDLIDPLEVDEVLERVAALAEPRGATSVRRLDLRRPGALRVQDWVQRAGSGRRTRAIESAVAHLEAAVVSAAPRAVRAWPWVELVRFEWRQMVRDTLAATLAAVDARDLDREAALHRLVREARDRVMAFEGWVRSIEPLQGATLALPALELTATGAPVRAVRAVGGRWMGEGDVELALWGAAVCPDEVRASWRELEQQVATARAGLTAASPHRAAGAPAGNSPSNRA